MSLIVISVDRDKLPKHTQDDFELWVEHVVGQRAGILITNPLCDVELSATVREIG